MRPHSPVLQWCAWLVPALSGCGGEGPEPGPRNPGATAPPGSAGFPDVVVIAVDTLRRDHLSSYGYARSTSPAIDSLAKQGILFENAYSPASWTTPGMGALLTSRYPTSLGIEHDQSVLPAEIDTLAELLQGAGYTTGAVISHTFCSSRWNFNQGFDSFDESNVLGHKAVTSRGVTDRALEFLDGVDSPFFLWAHYFDPHFGYVLHEGFDFDPESIYDGPVTSGMRIKELIKLKQRGKLSADDIEQVIRLYDSEIAFTDSHIGRLLQALRNSPRWDDTLVVFTSDHGEGFLEHDKLGHAKTLYSELINVPLIVKFPRGKSPLPMGQIASEAVSLVDVTPTILQLAGMTPPRSMVGIPLPQVIGSQVQRPLFAETSRMNKLRAVITGDRKLILDLGDQSVQLFDLKNDPGEETDIAATHPEQLPRLKSLLLSWFEQLESGAATAAEVEISDELRRQLIELGYGEFDKSGTAQSDGDE